MTAKPRPADPLDRVRATIALMRETGATRLKTADMEIELGPARVAVAAPAPDPKPEKAEPEPLCSCGCPEALHGVAGCLNGCALERCLPSPQKPAPEAT